MAWPFDVRPVPGPFGAQMLTLHFSVPWEDVPRVRQVVQQAADRSGVAATVDTAASGKAADVRVTASGDGDALQKFLAILAALASFLSALAANALRGALADIGFQVAPALGDLANSTAKAVQDLQKAGGLVPALVVGGLLVILLMRR